MKLESSEKRTILAVDDKLENLKVLIRYLEASGFELMVAQSGEEAFQHIERIVPDMILLDSDPLIDIENTRTISTVVTKGIVLRSEDIELLIQESANPSI